MKNDILPQMKYTAWILLAVICCDASAFAGTEAEYFGALSGIAAEVSVPKMDAPPAAPGFERADWLYLHRHLENGNNIAGSDLILKTILAAEPDNAGALWRLGRNSVYYGRNQASEEGKLRFFDQADRLLRKSVALNSDSADAHYWLGLLIGLHAEINLNFSAVGQIREQMNAALVLDPNYGAAHVVLGEMLFRLPWPMRSVSGAIKELSRGLRVSPRNTSIHPSLAKIYIYDDQTAQAKEVIRKFHEVADPEDPGAYDDHLQQIRSLEQ